MDTSQFSGLQRLPQPLIHFASEARSIGTLISASGFVEEDYPWTDRFIGRFPLPDWQRGLCWTVEQKVSFIESVFIGYDLGSVMVNGYSVENGVMVPMSDILLDGQQRVDALLSFVNNEFTVNGLYWRDLTRQEQRFFNEREIGRKSVQCFDEQALKAVYNHLNFSGVKHSLSEKAL